MYVYLKSKGEECYTTGFYKPEGTWVPESDHDTAEAAAERVRWLNGGDPPEPEEVAHEHFRCPQCGTVDSAEVGYWQPGANVPCSGSCGGFMERDNPHALNLIRRIKSVAFQDGGLSPEQALAEIVQLCEAGIMFE